MHETLYNMIYKRKSFHLFRGNGDEKLTAGELEDIRAFWQGLTPLCPDIRVAMRIVPEEETTNRHGQEYCLAFYSEKKENYLQNIGYLGQMMELYLVSRNIGTCWYGIGGAKETSFEGLDYVIMIAIGKVDDPAKFRKDLSKVKRKPIEEIWQGQPLVGVTDIARFAPSACNSQPWRVKREGKVLQVYRYLKPAKVGLMTPKIARYMNRIDMGIYLAILELCLKHRKVEYTLELHPDHGNVEEWTLAATVTLKDTAGGNK